MNTGDRVYTPRFCTVRIEEIFDSPQEAAEAGFTAPTFYQDPAGVFGVSGRSLDLYHMEFAAYRK